MNLTRLSALAIFSTSICQAQWQDITANVPGTVSIEENKPILADGSELYVLGSTGVFRSSNGGATFSALNTVSNTGAYDLAIEAERFLTRAGDYIYTGGTPGSPGIIAGYTPIHRIQSGQSAWAQASQASLPDTVFGDLVDDVAFDPATNSYYAASGLAGCYFSSDGVTWTERRTGLPTLGHPTQGPFVNGRGVTVRNGKAFLSVGHAVLGNTGDGGVYTSTDQGLTWTRSTPKISSATGTIAVFGNRLLTGTSGFFAPDDGIFYSDDNGATWEFTKFLNGRYDIQTNSTHLFAVGDKLLKFSATGGLTWDNLDMTGLPSGYSWTGIAANDTDVFITGYIFDANFQPTGKKMFKRALSNLNLTPTTQFLKPLVVADPTINEGTRFQVTAQAAGPSISYQWKRNNVAIPGQTGPTLTLDPVTSADAGTIFLEVTGTDGTITSASFTLRVVPSTPGNHDVSFAKTPLSRAGSVLLYDDLRVLQSDGNYLALFDTSGNLLKSRTISGTPVLRRGFIDSRGGLVMFGEIALTRLNKETLEQDPTFPIASFTPSTTIRINDAIELPGRGYLLALYRSSSLNGTPAPALTLLRYDGTIDTTFAPPIFGSTANAFSVKLTPEGKIIANITSATWAEGTPLAPLVRFHADGSRDYSFKASATTGSAIFTVQPDGKILFATGSNSRDLKRLNADGTPDTGFNPAGTLFERNIIGSIIEASGKILVYGDFEAYGSATAIGYARLNIDGTIDPTFDTREGFRSFATQKSVISAAYDPRGFHYLISDSTIAEFRSNPGRTGMARIFTDAPSIAFLKQPFSRNADLGAPLTLSTIVTSQAPVSYQWFKNGTSIPGANQSTYLIPSLSAGDAATYTVTASNASTSITSAPAKITITGAPVVNYLETSKSALEGSTLTLETTITGPGSFTFQWNLNGNPIPGQTSQTLNLVSAVPSQSGNYTLTATNSIASATGIEIPITITPVTGLQKPGNTPLELNSALYTLAILPDGSYLVGGEGPFTGSNVRVFSHISAAGAVINDAWANLGTAIPAAVITKILLSRDKTKVYVLGRKYRGGAGTPVLNRFNLDGTADNTFTPVVSTEASVISNIAELPDGRLIAHSVYSTLDSVTSSLKLYILGSNGVAQTGITGNIFINNVRNFLPLQDGSVLVAGSFQYLSGSNTQSGIIRILPDGTVDEDFPRMVSISLVDLDIQSTGKIIAAGNNSIIRLLADGTIDTTFNTTIPFNTIADIEVLPNDAIVLGGTNTIQIFPDGGLDTSFTPTTAFAGSVTAMDYRNDGSLYIGGGLTIKPGNTAADTMILTATAGDPFGTYLAAFNIPANLRGNNDDPDGDGIPNLLEYAYGTNPASSSNGTSLSPGNGLATGATVNSLFPAASLDPAGIYYTTLIRLPKSTKGVTIAPEASLDLINYGNGSATITPFGPPVDDGDFIIQSYFMTPKTSTAPRGFWRLSATR